MAKTTETVLAAELVLDMGLYPRHKTDGDNVNRLREAILAGVSLPAVIADKATKRVVDGFHRTTAYLKLYGDEATIEVEWREYASEAEMVLDAIVLNAGHGLKLSAYDQTRCVVMAEEFGLTTEQIAGALSITQERVESIRVTKTATASGQIVPVKRQVKHLAGRKLTKKQQEGHKKAGGMRPLFYVNQILNMIDNRS